MSSGGRGCNASSGHSSGTGSSSRVAPAADVQVIITTVVVVLIPVGAARKAASVVVVVLVVAAVLETLF